MSWHHLQFAYRHLVGGRIRRTDWQRSHRTAAVKVAQHRQAAGETTGIPVCKRLVSTAVPTQSMTPQHQWPLPPSLHLFLQILSTGMTHLLSYQPSCGWRNEQTLSSVQQPISSQLRRKCIGAVGRGPGRRGCLGQAPGQYNHMAQGAAGVVAASDQHICFLIQNCLCVHTLTKPQAVKQASRHC